MGNFGKRPINDASEAQQKRAPVTFMHDGEQRLDRRPYGKIERFVDPQGVVITLQLATPGDPAAKATAERIRLEKHAEGWVEHTKCPFRHGHHNTVKGLAREFAKMPRELHGECASDPIPMKMVDGERHANKACQHIEWLIADRVKREAVQMAKRNAARIKEEQRKAKQDELLAMQTEIAEEQLAERKARKKSQPKAPE